MVYKVEATTIAESDLDAVRPFDRAQILTAVEHILCYTPTQESRSRIKRLRMLDSPGYRLRVGDYRVYYDVEPFTMTVTILRILSKSASAAYLGQQGDN
jgi:mRNA-degrading endonuclease RelE of RelBE toxin-antitoxin system